MGLRAQVQEPRSVEFFLFELTGPSEVCVALSAGPWPLPSLGNRSDREVGSVGVLTLATGLPRAYFATENPSYPYLADGVGRVGSSNDFFPVNTSNVAGSIFEDAFTDVELVALKLPYRPRVDNFSNYTALRLFAKRWLEGAMRISIDDGVAVARTNHLALFSGHFFGASKVDPAGTAFGQAQYPYSYASVFVGTVESYLKLSTSRLTFNGEACTHEFSHLFAVDQTPDGTSSGVTTGHCRFNSYRPELRTLCTMHTTYSDPSGSILSDFLDGKVEFHFEPAYPNNLSEYYDIRQRPDPLPAF